MLTRRCFLPAAPRARALAAIGAAAFAGGSAGMVTLTLSQVLDDMGAADVLSYLRETEGGRQVAAAMLAAIALGVLEIVPLPRALDVALVALCSTTLVGAMALQGHAGAMLAGERPDVLPLAAQIVHLASVLAWAGPLLGLAWGAAPDTEAWVRAVGRFSRWALVAVGGFLGSGAALALLHLGTTTALGTTPYGRQVVVKCLVVAVLLAVAAHARWRTLPAAARRLRSRRLRGDMRAETMLLFLILAITSVLATSDPPHVHRPSEARHADVHITATLSVRGSA